MQTLISTPIRFSLVGKGHWRWALASMLTLTLACENGGFKPKPVLDGDKIFWSLDLDHHAVMLSKTAPYDTLRLLATPRNYQGTPLSGLPAARYVSRDPERVAVTSEGTLVAVNPTGSQPVWVVATLTTENLKHTDSALVRVVNVDPQPVLASFSIHPLLPDSAKLATRLYERNPMATNLAGREVFAEFPKDTLPVRATDPSGVPLDGLGVGRIPVYFRSSDSTIARLHRVTGHVLGIKPGRVTFYAATTVFGVRKEDTLPYRIGYPIGANIVLGAGTNEVPGSFVEQEYHVATGASVVWINVEPLAGIDLANLLFSIGFSYDPVPLIKVDVTFDEADLPNIVASDQAFSAIVGGGANRCLTFGVLANIRDCINGGNFVIGDRPYDPAESPPYPLIMAVRRFMAPGTYHYRSIARGTSGRIVVVDEQE